MFVFGLAGALAANRSDMDIFGHVVLAMLPAIGGGTLRDLILDVPVFWLGAPIYIWLAIAAAVIIYFFPPKVGRRLTALEWADAVGLSLFCVLGAAKAFALNPAVYYEFDVEYEVDGEEIEGEGILKILANSSISIVEFEFDGIEILEEGDTPLPALAPRGERVSP